MTAMMARRRHDKSRPRPCPLLRLARLICCSLDYAFDAQAKIKPRRAHVTSWHQMSRKIHVLLIFQEVVRIVIFTTKRSKNLCSALPLALALWTLTTWDDANLAPVLMLDINVVRQNSKKQSWHGRGPLKSIHQFRQVHHWRFRTLFPALFKQENQHCGAELNFKNVLSVCARV